MRAEMISFSWRPAAGPVITDQRMRFISSFRCSTLSLNPVARKSMTSCSSETLCLLPSKQMNRDTPSQVPTQDISFLYHRDGFLFAAGCGLPVQRTGDLHQWLHLSSIAPECLADSRQNLIMFFFGDRLEDVALNVGDAPIEQGVIVIKFLGVRGLILYIIAHIHIDHLNLLWYIAHQGEED